MLVCSTISLEASLVVTNQVDNAQPIINDPLYIFVTVANTGPGLEQGVAIRNIIPSQLTFVSSIASQGSYTDGDGLWMVGDIAPGESAKLAIATTVNSNTEDQPFFNTSELLDAYDGVDCYGSDSCFATAEISSVALCKFDGVRVQDPLPFGTVFCSATTASGHYDPYSGIWDIGRININETHTLTLVLKATEVLAFSSFDNVATLDIPYGDDAYDSNNQVSVTVAVLPAVPDVAVDKRATNSVPEPNEAFSYVITVTNTNPLVATDSLVIEDVLPAELMFCSSFATQGSYVVSSDAWNLGVLSGGGSAQLIITVMVENSTAADTIISNTAVFNDPYNNDVYSENNSSTVDVTVALPKVCDLVVDKVADKSQIDEGEKVTFTVTVRSAATCRVQKDPPFQSQPQP